MHLFIVNLLLVCCQVHYADALLLGQPKVPEVALYQKQMNFSAPPVPVTAHFMEQTYGHLRNGSNRVETALQNLLEVQSSLDEMQEDMASEYSRWEEKKQSLAAERLRHEQELSRLQNVLKEQAAAREEAKRLQGELALEVEWHAKTASARAEAQVRWQQEQVDANNEIAALNAKINATMIRKVERTEEILNVTHLCQEENREMQQQILILNGQVQQLEDVRSKLNAVSQATHSKLLEQIKHLQDGMHSLQVKMIEQAKLRMDQRRLSSKTNTLVKQRESIQSFVGACDRKLEEIDRQVAEVKKGVSELPVKARECQVTDAENQELQAKLNRCRSEQWSAQ